MSKDNSLERVLNKIMNSSDLNISRISGSYIKNKPKKRDKNVSRVVNALIQEENKNGSNESKGDHGKKET